MNGSIVYTSFNPHGNGFIFDFNEWDCYKIKNGVCSLELISYIGDKMNDGYISENDIRYCPYIYRLIRKNGYNPELYPVSISRYKCGHYEMDSGRHRICIAGHMNITIPLRISEAPCKCIYCDCRDFKNNYKKIGLRKSAINYLTHRKRVCTYI